MTGLTSWNPWVARIRTYADKMRALAQVVRNYRAQVNMHKSAASLDGIADDLCSSLYKAPYRELHTLCLVLAVLCLAPFVYYLTKFQNHFDRP